MWELTKVYVDEGITGTSTKKRHAFNRMIADAQERSFDLLITKEISRFARNTLDSIYYTRKLKELGIGVIFMNDNINTLDPDSELRLTIMSSIAQEESRKTSDRVKWGQKRRMEQGVVFGRDMLGFDVKDGRLIKNEDGAKTVRLIFHKFVSEGKGTHVIARELREAGIPTATYMNFWSNTVILRILRNEKYCGDLIQKKTFTPSYLDHEKKYNHGEEEFVTIRDHHEPIISRELFEKTQRELQRRSHADDKKAKHSNRYCFSGKLKCGVCGCSYVSRTKKRDDGSVTKSWRCYESVNHGSLHTDSAGIPCGCDNHSVHDEDLQTLMLLTVKSLLTDRQDIIDNLYRAVHLALKTDSRNDRSGDLQNQIDKLSQKRQTLIEMYLNKDISETDYQKIVEKYDAEISAAEKALCTMCNSKEPCGQADHRQRQIEDTIEGLISGILWDDSFYRHIVDKIIIHENNVLDVYLVMLPEKRSYLLSSSKHE